MSGGGIGRWRKSGQSSKRPRQVGTSWRRPSGTACRRSRSIAGASDSIGKRFRHPSFRSRLVRIVPAALLDQDHRKQDPAVCQIGFHGSRSSLVAIAGSSRRDRLTPRSFCGSRRALGARDDPGADGCEGVACDGPHGHAEGLCSLALQVQEVLKHDPLGGHIFCFRGRRGDLIKVIWHDGQAANLYVRRLERGTVPVALASGRGRDDHAGADGVSAIGDRLAEPAGGRGVRPRSADVDRPIRICFGEAACSVIPILRVNTPSGPF